MFKKQFESIYSLKNELVARETLSNLYVSEIREIDYESLIISFNKYYFTLEKLIYFINAEGFYYEKTFYKLIFSLINSIRFMNSKGIIHLDLKPSNIVIDIGFQVKIIDFESYIDTNNNNEPLPISKGNFLYRAPERDTDEYGVESNIYSLGLLVYFIVHGRHPYYGMTYEEIASQKKSWQIEYSPIIHPLLRYFIDSCINPDPKKRFIFDLEQHFDFNFFPLKINYTMDEIHSFVLMHSVMAKDVHDEIAEDLYQYFYLNGAMIMNNPTFSIPLYYYNYDDLGLPYDEDFCDFTFLEVRDSFNKIAMDTYDVIMHKITYEITIDFNNVLPIYGIDEDTFLDLTSCLPEIRSYQEIFGKGLALDVIEGTYHHIQGFRCIGHYAYSYIICQPIIMAIFPDAPELLCMDFTHLKVPSLSCFRSYLFPLEATNLNELCAAILQYGEVLSPSMFTSFISALMSEEFGRLKLVDSYFTFEDYRVSSEELKEKRPQMDLYFDVIREFSLYLYQENNLCARELLSEIEHPCSHLLPYDVWYALSMLKEKLT